VYIGTGTVRAVIGEEDKKATPKDIADTKIVAAMMGQGVVSSGLLPPNALPRSRLGEVGPQRRPHHICDTTA
jgi:hypothetical protein